jgi:Yip1 domain
MSLVSRVQNILLKPKSEWAVIDAEPATVNGILTSYVMILAAIGPICSIIGSSVIGVYGIKFPFSFSVASAVFAYILAIAGVYIAALVIDALAPSFGATKDSVRAMKVAAYAATPVFIAGVFQIFPLLAWVVWIGSLYGWYLLYLGLGTVMKSPQDKTVVYTIVVVVVEVIIAVVFAMIVGMVVLSIFGAALMSAPAVVHY